MTHRSLGGAGRVVVVAMFMFAIYFNVTGHAVHAWTISHYQQGLERAHIAALMIEHGISRIYTRDTAFHRFPGIEVIDPLA